MDSSNPKIRRAQNKRGKMLRQPIAGQKQKQQSGRWERQGGERACLFDGLDESENPFEIQLQQRRCRHTKTQHDIMQSPSNESGAVVSSESAQARSRREEPVQGSTNARKQGRTLSTQQDRESHPVHCHEPVAEVDVPDARRNGL
jgi:hypothetical protein